jgi:hypothetical protein
MRRDPRVQSQQRIGPNSPNFMNSHFEFGVEGAANIPAGGSGGNCVCGCECCRVHSTFPGFQKIDSISSCFVAAPSLLFGKMSSDDCGNKLSFLGKKIQFLGRRRTILCQNHNGPCALLALVNTLVLTDKISLPENEKSITLHDLSKLIENHYIKVFGMGAPTPNAEESVRDSNNQQLRTILGLIPLMSDGLNLNLFFTSVTAFEAANELLLFSSLNISLFHGWLLDPQRTQEAQVIGPLSYDAAMSKLLAHKSVCEQSNQCPSESSASISLHSDQQQAGCQLTAQQEQLKVEATTIEGFLVATKSQLTRHGLKRLLQTIEDGEVAVFFRNNHYSTLYKTAGALYVLVTDEGYANHPDVVWECVLGLVLRIGMFGEYCSHICNLYRDRESAFVDADFDPAGEGPSSLNSVLEPASSLLQLPLSKPSNEVLGRESGATTIGSSSIRDAEKLEQELEANNKDLDENSSKLADIEFVLGSFVEYRTDEISRKQHLFDLCDSRPYVKSICLLSFEQLLEEKAQLRSLKMQLRSVKNSLLGILSHRLGEGYVIFVLVQLYNSLCCRGCFYLLLIRPCRP